MVWSDLTTMSGIGEGAGGSETSYVTSYLLRGGIGNEAIRSRNRGFRLVFTKFAWSFVKRWRERNPDITTKRNVPMPAMTLQKEDIYRLNRRVFAV